MSKDLTNSSCQKDSEVILNYFKGVDVNNAYNLNELAREMLDDIYWLDAYSNYSKDYILKEVAVRQKVISITSLLADKI